MRTQLAAPLEEPKVGGFSLGFSFLWGEQKRPKGACQLLVRRKSLSLFVCREISSAKVSQRKVHRKRPREREKWPPFAGRYFIVFSMLVAA